MKRDAVISDCGVYRYWLQRSWGEGSTLVVVGLNPSTADANVDDPTIRKCIHYAKREGHTKLVMLNLFAVRATDPKELPMLGGLAVGPQNDTYLSQYLDAYPRFLAAWGAVDKRMRWLIPRVVHESNRAVCLGHTKEGFPRHPLYMRNDAPFVPFVRKEPSGAGRVTEDSK